MFVGHCLDAFYTAHENNKLWFHENNKLSCIGSWPGMLQHQAFRTRDREKMLPVGVRCTAAGESLLYALAPPDNCLRPPLPAKSRP